VKPLQCIVHQENGLLLIGLGESNYFASLFAKKHFRRRLIPSLTGEGQGFELRQSPTSTNLDSFWGLCGFFLDLLVSATRRSGLRSSSIISFFMMASRVFLLGE
jgi:hypothetical protein